MPPMEATFTPSDWLALASITVAGTIAIVGYAMHFRLQRGRYRYETWAGIQSQRVTAYAEFRNRALRIMEQQRSSRAPDEFDLQTFADSHGMVQLICGPLVAKTADAVYRLVFDCQKGSDVSATFAPAMKDLKDQMQRELGVIPF